MIRGVNEDIDAAADLAGKIFDGARIGEIERHQRNLLGELRQAIEARRLFPRLGIAGPDQVGAGSDDGFDQRLSERRFGVGNQDFAEFRIAGHFAKLAIVGHVRGILLRNCDKRRLPCFVEAGDDVHARRRRRAIAMQMGDHDRSAIELDHAEPPRHAFAVKQFVAVMQQRFGNELAGAVLRAPVEPLRQACAARLPRRILHCSAVAADLQFELAARRRGSKPKRDTAATARRQRRHAASAGSDFCAAAAPKDAS